MGFDYGGGTFYGDGFDYVGIECALYQEFYGQAGGGREKFTLLFDKDSDEFVANDLALRLGVGHSREPCQEARARINGNKIKSKLLAKILLHLEEFVLAQHAVVDKDASETVTNRAMHQHSRDRRIHSARKGTDRMAIANFLADGGNGGLNEVLRRPIRLGLADIEEEVADVEGDAEEDSEPGKEDA